MGDTPSSRALANPNTPSYAVLMVTLTAILCYLAAQLGGVLVLRPLMVWPLWPGCAVLVALLLLTPRKLWPLLVLAGLAGFVVYDLRIGLPARSIAFLILADTFEVFIAAFGISYSFDGIPRLNSVKVLGRYAFWAVLLAPLSVASIGAVALGGEYWAVWRVSFLTEALALLTVTPAILGWMEWGRSGTKKSWAHYLEAITLMVSLTFFAYVTFAVFRSGSRPELLYVLLPFLLWAALRFGITGVSSSMIAIAFLSIWGAIHGRGPFTEQAPLNNVWSLQLFLLFASSTFMALAAVVDEHKQAAKALREGEERFRLVCNTVPAMIWMSDPDKLCTYFNQPWLDFTGRPIEAELGNGWLDGVHPQSLQSCINTYSQAFDRRQRYEMEYRLRRRDGEYRWIRALGVPRFNYDGSFVGYAGSCIDVTDYKLAEEALSSVSQRLIQAQEQERARIARELHDDINQRIALITIDLKRLEQTSNSLAAVGSQIAAIKDRLADLGTEVQAISHRLHSSKLEYLGLVAAAASFCRELAVQHEVKIDFSHEGVPSPLPFEISLCLFRVLQEGLTNAVKHSGVRLFAVDLRGISDHIHLSVIDRGVGFDPKAAMTSKGLGLISMQERLNLVKGALSIASELAHGTTIHASVPYTSGNAPSRAVA